MRPTRNERCSWSPSTVQMPLLAAPCGQPPLQKPARSLRAALWAREESSPLGSRREAAAALWCLPPAANFTAFGPQAPGDVLLMKGGLWEQGSHGGGAAHRAPAIGPVPTCTAHRLMLKVDVSEDF